MARAVRSRPRQDTLEVWLDAEIPGAPRRVGTLAHDRGQVRFHYETSWLTHPSRFVLDPDLSLDAHPFFPDPRAGNFGIFLDSSPDRWGQTLMDRREALQAKDEGRPARSLQAWDYLLGVQDVTRQGALRFRAEGTDVFLDNQLRAAPPVTNLRELELVALELTRRDIDDLDRLRQWLAALMAPGASLGGARPKANFLERDQALWIAKFPSRDDHRDIAAWEKLAHTLARGAGIDTPEARLVRLGAGHHTYCTRRFDRRDGRRVFFASAMTVLGKETSEGASYLEIAQFAARHGAPTHIQTDLEQLFRRVAFNVAIGNRDDHLRNHGFLLSATGWRLAPAYDVNPSPEKTEHVLALDDSDPRPNLDTVVGTAPFYRLTPRRGREIVDEVRAIVGAWRSVAARLRIAKADVQLTARAFNAVE